MKCPRCSFDQPDDIYCVKCGVEVDKWRSSRKGKMRQIKWYAAGAGAVLALGLIIWLLAMSGGTPDGEMKGVSDSILTAEDVIFSWERALEAGTGSDTALTYLGDIVGAAEVHDGRSERVSGLKAIDDHTLEVRIDLPKVYFLSKLTYPVAFVVDKHNVEQPDWQHNPNGTGPFQLQEWSDDEILVLARNEGTYQELPALKPNHRVPPQPRILDEAFWHAVSSRLCHVIAIAGEILPK